MSQRSSGSQRISLTEDERLLTPAPVSVDRRAPFTSTDPWRVLRIMGEFVEGFDTLSDIRNAVTIFGSARTPERDPYYQKALDTARLLAREGFPIITGGGPGVMEAANRGAQEGNGLSIGCNIELPFEQGTNAYVERSINFRYFFVRKTMFVKYSTAFLIFPGGFGTLDELFEALTLIQTGKVRNFPVVLFDRDYWREPLHWINGRLLDEGMISHDDLALLHSTDDHEEAAEIVLECYRKACAEKAEPEAPPKEDAQ